MLDSATALSIMEDKLCSRYKSVKDAFVHMDYDLDGRISAAEFRVTLDLMGLVMSDEEFLRLWQYFDTEGVGFLNYTAFNNKVGAMIHPPITKPVIDRPQTPRVRRANAKRIASRLKKTMLNLRDAFNMIDSDHSGRISHAEFIQALRHVGLNKIGHDQSYELMVKVRRPGRVGPPPTPALLFASTHRRARLRCAAQACRRLGGRNNVRDVRQDDGGLLEL